MLHMARHRDVLAHVGDNLRRIRESRGVSQVALAATSGISRRTILNLEAGDANISLSGLDRLAEALETTFVELVAAPTDQRTQINQIAWQGKGGSEAVLLGSAPASREAQLWSWSLGPGDRYDAEPDPAGWHELLVVSEGALVVEFTGGPIRLVRGEHLIFSSAQQYAYVNVTLAQTRFYRTVAS